MSDFTVYTIEPTEDDSETFVFESEGANTILKAIRYAPIQSNLDKPVFNLGFGDYDPKTSTLSDGHLSNNGDHYKVFGTVLSTVPDFFYNHPGSYVFVQGSDSTPEFAEGCRATCKKKCNGVCKNLGRRICVYCRFVSKHLDVFSVEYQIYGVIFREDGTIIEPFEKEKIYNGILIDKKS